jgi:hypothetical protein
MVEGKGQERPLRAWLKALLRKINTDDCQGLAAEIGDDLLCGC